MTPHHFWPFASDLNLPIHAFRFACFSHVCSKLCVPTMLSARTDKAAAATPLRYMQRKLRKDYRFCGKERADNGCVKLSSRERLKGKWPAQSSAQRSLWGGVHAHTHTYKHARTLLYKDRERRGGTRRRCKENGSSGVMGQGVDVQFVSHTHTRRRKTWRKPRAIRANSWLLPACHRDGVVYSHVDDNLTVVNCHTEQLKPQQVSDVDGVHTWVSHCVLTTLAEQDED